MKYSRQRVKGAFSKSASSYNEAAILQKEIVSRLIAKLKVLQSDAMRSVLDVGSGTGLACHTLSDMFGRNSYHAFDFSHEMLRFAQQANKNISQQSVCGDVVALPYQKEIFDVVFSASTYQWCNDLNSAFSNALYVLKENGLFIFSSFGPGTLKELRYCFNQVDNEMHVSSFVDIQQHGDTMLAAGFYAPVIESESITVEYNSPLQLLSDLRATGATNHLEGRKRGLMSRSRLQAMLEEYEKLALGNGKYPATYKVIYGHGWKKPIDLPQNGTKSQWQPISFK